MSVDRFEFVRLLEHVGHEIECVTYHTVNVAVECVTCSMVLIDCDAPEDMPEKEIMEIIERAEMREKERQEQLQELLEE